MHIWAFLGALMLASGIALGAYGAHGLRAAVTVPRLIESYEYAVLYQLISGLGFFAVAWATQHFKTWLVNIAGIYLLVLIQWRPFPLVTPISGFFMIAAWVVMAIAALTSQPKRSSFY